MTSGILDISNVINVSVSSLPSGLDVPNVNSLALFSTETPGNEDPFRVYLNASDVGTDYGTDSVTYEMAIAIFSQSPNILSGDGRLVIIPLDGSVGAIAGYFTTANISANVTNIEGVNNGDLRVTLNGSNVDLTGLDFTGASTLAAIAVILQAALTNAVVSVVGNTIKVASRQVGVDADVVLTALPGGIGTNLAGATYFNTASGVATSGADGTGETLVAAIERTKELVQYVGVITNLEMDDTVFQTTSNAIQSQNRIFLHHFASSEDIAGIITDITEAGNTHTRCLLYLVSLAEANLMKAAYAGRAFSCNFSGSKTTFTMNLKPLATILPDSGMTQTIYTNAETAGADMYVSYAGVPSVVSAGANDYFDNVYNQIWLKFAIEVAGFNFLRQTTTKVPQNETGMDGLKGAYRKVMNQAVFNGMVSAGLEWNSSETFGNPDDFRRNIRDAGFYIYSLPIALQSQSDREDRKAPLVQIAAKLGGAIQQSSVIVIIER